MLFSFSLSSDLFPFYVLSRGRPFRISSSSPARNLSSRAKKVPKMALLVENWLYDWTLLDRYFNRSNGRPGPLIRGLIRKVGQFGKRVSSSKSVVRTTGNMGDSKWNSNLFLRMFNLTWAKATGRKLGSLSNKPNHHIAIPTHITRGAELHYTYIHILKRKEREIVYRTD